MTDLKATETCSCGASVTAEGYQGGVRESLDAWRKGHRHEAAGRSAPSPSEPAPPPPAKPVEDRGSVSATAATGQSMPWQFGFARPEVW